HRRYRRVARRGLASGRPRARLHRHRRRQDDFAVFYRERAAREPLCGGGRGVRAWPQISDGRHRDRLRPVADWARTNNVGYTGFTSLTTHPQIERLMRAEIDRVNGDLARVEQIKSFRILPKALDPEE